MELNRFISAGKVRKSRLHSKSSCSSAIELEKENMASSGENKLLHKSSKQCFTVCFKFIISIDIFTDVFHMHKCFSYAKMFFICINVFHMHKCLGDSNI